MGKVFAFSLFVATATALIETEFLFNGDCEKPESPCTIHRAAAVHEQPAQLREVSNGDLAFLSIGDWGCGATNCIVDFGTIQRHLTAGPTQARVAASMGRSADEVKSQFVLALGDNFYHRGVTSPDDPLWDSVWQSRFTAAGLQTPWYVLLGNHDHYGNAQAQIDYSVQGRDSRWVLPNYYYSTVRHFGLPGEEASLQLVMIDTVILDEGHTRDILEEKIRQGLVPARALEEFDARRHIRAGAAEAQLQWLADVLSTSKADWLVVAGHYPVFSGGEHGSTGTLIQEVKPMLEKYGVHAYLSGHDHTAQHLADKGVNYYVVGNGCFLGTVKPIAQTLYAQVVSGYAVHQAGKARLTTTFLDDSGAPLYTHTIVPRLPAAAA